VKVLILAGGRGTRLSGVVPDRPKPMADISGQPFLSYQMDYLIAQKIQELVLSVGYKAEFIQDFYKDNYKNLNIDYAHETEPLGTGGAILNGLKINNQNSENNFLILNGDTFFDLNILNFEKFFLETQADIAVGLAYVKDTSRYGKVFLDERTHQILSFGEKNTAGPGWINAGAYLLGPKVLEILKKLNQESFSWESEILSRAGELGLKIFGFKSEGANFIDIGIPEDYERAQRALPVWLGENS